MREQVLVCVCLLLISGTWSKDHKVAKKSGGSKKDSGGRSELPKVLKEFRSFADSVKHGSSGDKKLETVTDEQHAEIEDGDNEDITAEYPDDIASKFLPENLSEFKKLKSLSQVGTAKQYAPEPQAIAFPQGKLKGKTVLKQNKGSGKPKKGKEDLVVPLDDAGDFEDINNKDDDSSEIEDLDNKDESADAYHDENEDKAPDESAISSGDNQLAAGDVEKNMSAERPDKIKEDYSGDDYFPADTPLVKPRKGKSGKKAPKTSSVLLNKFKNRKYKVGGKLKALPKIHEIPESRSAGGQPKPPQPQPPQPQPPQPQPPQPKPPQQQPQQPSVPQNPHDLIPPVIDGMPVEEAQVQQLPPLDQSITLEDLVKGGIPAEGGMGMPAPMAPMPAPMAPMPPMPPMMPPMPPMPAQTMSLQPVLPVAPPMPMAAPPAPYPNLCPANCAMQCTGNCEQNQCCGDNMAPPPVQPLNQEDEKEIKWMERAKYEPGPNYPPPPAPPVVARIMTCSESCPARCAPACDSTCCPQPTPPPPIVIGCNKRSCTPNSCTPGCPAHCCARYLDKHGNRRSEILGLQHHTRRKQARKMADI